MEEGQIVVATWGYNDITKKPFSFLYDYGYKAQGGHVVYKHGECNLQDAKLFQESELRVATEEEINKMFWGL